MSIFKRPNFPFPTNAWARGCCMSMYSQRDITLFTHRQQFFTPFHPKATLRWKHFRKIKSEKFYERQGKVVGPMFILVHWNVKPELDIHNSLTCFSPVCSDENSEWYREKLFEAHERGWAVWGTTFLIAPPQSGFAAFLLWENWIKLFI